LSGLVLDASVTLAWCFDDESAEALTFLEASGPFHVPAVWSFEVANGLAVGERRKRLAAADAARFLTLLGGLDLVVAPPPTLGRLPALLGLARAHALSIYDVAYLDLAQRLGLPLATLDGGLARAAVAVGLRRAQRVAR
jgi:predicted nucleic acid-binding protein